MKSIKLSLIVFWMMQVSFSFGQFGGRQSFEFLNLPVGARVAGLGGVVISSTDQDVNLFMSNPSMLDSANQNHLSWSYYGFYADVKYNTLAYAYDFDRLGPIGIGIQHLGYGDFDRIDELGNENGSFSGGETAVTLSKSHQISVFRMGLSLKFINTNLDTYSSSALAFDLGGSFIHPGKELIVSLLFKNVGVVLSDFTGTSDSSLPRDVQVGLTYKPEHMPFRLTTTIYNLNKSNGTFHDPSINEEEPATTDKLFRHVNLGVEIVFNQNFNIRTGYNHLIRKELSLEERAGLTGFTLGFMARVKAFELSYVLATYQVGGGRSYFTITSNLNRIFNKKSLL